VYRWMLRSWVSKKNRGNNIRRRGESATPRTARGASLDLSPDGACPYRKFHPAEDGHPERPPRRGHFSRHAGGPRILIYTGKIEFKSASDRPTVNIAQHVAESTADVDDGNAPVRGQATVSCEVKNRSVDVRFEFSYRTARRPVL
jgi:hypothetical protein